jgi:DNA-binding NarL/FixJ family response regulator
MIHVLIAADIWLYREGLAHLLGQHGGFRVVGTSCDRSQTTARFRELRPDVVLLDLSTPESRAIIRDLGQLAPGVPVVAIAVANRVADVLSCIEAGVVGYVSRDGSLADLVTAVESAARGELRCSPALAGSLVRRFAALAAERDARVSPVDESAHLTIREREIVRLLEDNLSNKEIAVRLGIEVATVKNHVHNLLEKLNLRRRVDVAMRSTTLRASMSSIDQQPFRR